MKALFFASILALASTAGAHVEPGTYVGKTPEGTACSMVAGKTFFEGGVKHPLNERISISVNGDTLIVGHPPVVDSNTGVVKFNHDLFQRVIATKTGARALEIVMEHSDTFEGPRSFTWMDDSWTEKKRSSIKCMDLKHTGP